MTFKIAVDKEVMLSHFLEILEPNQIAPNERYWELAKEGLERMTWEQLDAYNHLVRGHRGLLQHRRDIGHRHRDDLIKLIVNRLEYSPDNTLSALYNFLVAIH